jgi:hypothetical protein
LPVGLGSSRSFQATSYPRQSCNTSDESQARQAHVDWLNHLNTFPDNGSPTMREKLTDLFNASAQAALDTLSARETVSSFQRALNEATGDFTFAQAAQKKIAEER